MSYKIVTDLFAHTYKTIDVNGNGKNKNNTILMGSYVQLLNENKGIWTKVKAFSKTGWIEQHKIGDEPGLKVFYVDVGQGDGALIEIGNSFKMLIDGGPGNNLANYLSKWQYLYYFKRNEKVHFDYVFVSHFDKDHYNGLIDILNDDRYTFGTIYHNGIAKFDTKKSDFPADWRTTLGETHGEANEANEKLLITTFDSIDELNVFKERDILQAMMEKFTLAVTNAITQGRAQNFIRADFQTPIIHRNIANKDFTIEFLGPIPSEHNGGLAFHFFEDESHTVNGHSLVLKIKYGESTLLFGGDLNIPSEKHLLQHYQRNNPFEVDVAKSCHHGASEFTVEFMASINPLATIISSGDNESYSHPRADAIGCAGKYSRAQKPLVFSTELARSTNVKKNLIQFGMINLRSNGDSIIMAQMKEAKPSSSLWDIYQVKPVEETFE
ncbi:hypothetical protein AHMF7605_08100 [Adhaeribacter arboris]|uniref:Metallo-beta-lactamase domain-containing protein n=1 Tax=Adhaeribacter arboris TaxID=2072846 RepID=A0A2T2YDF1_9BACT|nr:MBL fold metallo-hydrolase [Adhaeribacter arboris]PSR53488.1 hypothetical protein AHMF7605_08100 [Adhaeribacter arboris]